MISRPNTALSQIHMQIMWSRLIAVVEEQAQTLMRTAFSTTVREAGDLSAGVFDCDGNMLAQAVTGTPAILAWTGQTFEEAAAERASAEISPDPNPEGTTTVPGEYAR